MPTLINNTTGATIAVAQQPVFTKGMWECGNARFHDPNGTLYSAGAAALPALTPMQFYLAFTPAERIAIKKLATTDPNVGEFWATYEMSAAAGTSIDPSLVSVQEGLGYLTTVTPPVLTTDRVAQIVQGIPQ